MKTIRFLALLLVAFISSAVHAQSQRELGQLMRERGEYYFTISVADPAEIQTISSICSVDGTDGRNVVAYANQQEYDKLLREGYQPSLQTPPSLRANVTMWDGNGTYNWDAYLTYTQYVTMMESFPNKTIEGRECTLFSLGTLSTSNHRQLLGVRINNGSPEGKPKFLYTSTMHGDEITGMILMLRLINELCTSTDSQIVDLVNNLDIYIMPLTNPDGTYKGGNNTVNSAQRYNGNNIDLNRNYKDYYQGAHPDGNAYEDETIWTMAFGDENLFTMSANYHGGAEVMNYPWDAVYDDHVDKDWYEYVCSEYVQIARQTYSSYMSDTYSDGVTSGAAWYVITGSRQDYMNAYAQCREVTVECSTTKTPAANQLPYFWNYNRNSMLAFMEQALKGVHGFVYDASTNEPISGATITVLHHDNDLSKVTTHDAGDFHRPIKGGSYTLKITKDGYCQETLDVTVADGQQVNLQVYLTPEGDCPIPPVSLNCYEQVMPSATGSYIMGYLNGTSLVMPTHNSSSTMTTTSTTVNPTDNGFSVEEETILPQVTLTAYGSNGQYYISYNNRYLSRSTYGGSLTWGSSQSSSGRWYINSNGIYVTSSNRNYYLYYNGSNFALSTSQQNNIHFYVQGECSTPSFAITATASPEEGGTIEGAGTYAQGETCTLIATANDGYTFINWTENGEEASTEMSYSFNVTADRTLVANFDEDNENIVQTSTMAAGWNQWSPNVDLSGTELLAQLKQALGTNGIKIMAQNGRYLSYNANTNTWAGNLTTLEVGLMYKIETANSCEITITGPAIDPTTQSVTIYHGNNWIGFFGSEPRSVNEALSNYTPTQGDKIMYNNRYATFNGTSWVGNLTQLVPGNGYIYKSNATSSQTLVFN